MPIWRKAKMVGGRSWGMWCCTGAAVVKRMVAVWGMESAGVFERRLALSELLVR